MTLVDIWTAYTLLLNGREQAHGRNALYYMTYDETIRIYDECRKCPISTVGAQRIEFYANCFKNHPQFSNFNKASVLVMPLLSTCGSESRKLGMLDIAKCTLYVFSVNGVSFTHPDWKNRIADYRGYFEAYCYAILETLCANESILVVDVFGLLFLECYRTYGVLSMAHDIGRYMALPIDAESIEVSELFYLDNGAKALDVDKTISVVNIISHDLINGSLTPRWFYRASGKSAKKKSLNTSHVSEKKE